MITEQELATRRNICTSITNCRLCGSAEFRSVINLGDQHVASIFVNDEVPELLQRPYPLEVVRCAGNGGCGLVQLQHSIAPDILYNNYGYRSGTNEMMRANLRDITSEIEKLIPLKPGDIVLDIGCNDGTLLAAYEARGIDRIGFDPAPNVAAAARERGFEVVNDFFAYEPFAAARPNRKARVVTSIAMFYDLEAPMQFVREVEALLAADGVWVIELSYMPFMLQKNSFDTICHEHLEYYALRQIEWMVERAGLRVHKVQLNDVNGGSFRLFIRRQSAGAVPAHASVEIARLRDSEQRLGLHLDEAYQRFREGTLRVRDDLVRLLEGIRASGKVVYVYGASTKGNTLLQYYGIDHRHVGKAADRNPEKWGRRTLGTDIPIVSEDEARADGPDYFLVLPWHFFEGFVAREREFLERGGKFIVPLPEVRVVGSADL